MRSDQLALLVLVAGAALMLVLAVHGMAGDSLSALNDAIGSAR